MFHLFSVPWKINSALNFKYALGDRFKGFIAANTVRISYSTMSWCWNSRFDGTPPEPGAGDKVSSATQLCGIGAVPHGTSLASPSAGTRHMGPHPGTWRCHRTPDRVSSRRLPELGRERPLGWGWQQLMKRDTLAAQLTPPWRIRQDE